MWGVTPLDQLWCRLKFREARYEGPFTPPGLTPAIQMPGPLGGMEWGGAAVDIDRGIAIVNTNHMPRYTRLLPRAEADKLGLRRITLEDLTHPPSPLPGWRVLLDELLCALGGGCGGWPQEGTPYAALTDPFLSPLQVPCNRPPYGRLSAVDLKTGRLVWTQVLGTARDSGPLGFSSHLPIPLGTPNVGGALVTRSGLLFIGATQERSLRAYETATGKLLWQARLPAGGTATPITYISPESGRQFVVIAAGGNGQFGSQEGDFLVAYALPKGAN
jgi:quinoprotein glucose dehydrogenase